MRGEPEHSDLPWACRQLRASGRGKHLVQFSYYHVDLISKLPDVAEFLLKTEERFSTREFDFNVVKLSRTRLSFLRYEHFAQPFPALLAALTCDMADGTSRFTDYSSRANPPILHRKELLLPADHPLVPGAAQLTECLERLGAFKDTTRIGTRDGWNARLRSLGVEIEDGVVVPA